MRNARFWVYINGGPVKITLKSGRRNLRWEHWQQTDEGWSLEAYQWQHDGDQVREFICHDGVDCDGLLTQSSVWKCPLDHLKAGYKPYFDNWLTMEEREFYVEVVYPEWQKESAEQRDYAAEAAGY